MSEEKNTEKGWREELNKKFFGGIPMEEMGSNQVSEQELQIFISDVEARAREEERERIEKIVKESFMQCTVHTVLLTNGKCADCNDALNHNIALYTLQRSLLTTPKEEPTSTKE